MGGSHSRFGGAGIRPRRYASRFWWASDLRPVVASKILHLEFRKRRTIRH